MPGSMGKTSKVITAGTGRWALCVSLILGLLPAGLMAAEPQESVPLVSLEWPPYIGESLEGLGPTYQIVAEALGRGGYAPKVEFLPWARAIEVARSAQVAGVFPEYYEPARDAEFLFSDPLPGGPVVFYKRRADGIRFAADPRTDPEGAFLGLRQYRFGVVRGYVNTRTFDAASYLTKDEATSDEINLKKLAYGRVDLIVIDALVARYLLQTRLPDFADQLDLMRPPLEYKPLYVAFNRKHPKAGAYLAALNAGLASMRADGRIDAILAGYDMRPEPSAEALSTD